VHCVESRQRCKVALCWCNAGTLLHVHLLLFARPRRNKNSKVTQLAAASWRRTLCVQLERRV
jgi:hypothetical protein